jgi:hypothetical protein
MTPTEVAELIEEDLGIKDFTKQAVEKYDPTKFAGQKLSEDLKNLFWEEREAFKRDLSNIDVANRSFRIAELSRLYRKAKEDGKDVIAARHLEQAAKEEGGFFTNKRVHSGPNDGPIPISLPDQKKDLAAKMLKKLTDNGMKAEEARASLLAMGVNESDIPSL